MQEILECAIFVQDTRSVCTDIHLIQLRQMKVHIDSSKNVINITWNSKPIETYIDFQRDEVLSLIDRDELLTKVWNDVAALLARGI